MEQNSRKNNKINGNNIIKQTTECFVSMAELHCPKKKIKVEDLSTVTLGYIKDKSTNKENENLRMSESPP